MGAPFIATTYEADQNIGVGTSSLGDEHGRPSTDVSKMRVGTTSLGDRASGVGRRTSSGRRSDDARTGHRSASFGRVEGQPSRGYDQPADET